MPDALSRDAIDALGLAVDELLPSDTPAGLNRTRVIEAQRVRLLGLGGYVGNHVEPEAALFGRRLAARVSISIGGGNEANARAHASSLANHLLCLSRSELGAAGVHRLQRADSADARVIVFDIDFEFISTPTTAEGVISDLVLDIAPDG
ncbi:hypothetical protein [Thauera sp.]|uniref:hypothetical protein n=1 Tax=Thauera sp. TaxID=1905334 RepID=UPI002B6A1616|nr:hypothetical protein [Thauera sp.]HRP22814.1 hypothetical protein [Thauera sp.]